MRKTKTIRFYQAYAAAYVISFKHQNKNVVSHHILSMEWLKFTVFEHGPLIPITTAWHSGPPASAGDTGMWVQSQ